LVLGAIGMMLGAGCADGDDAPQVLDVPVAAPPQPQGGSGGLDEPIAPATPGGTAGPVAGAGGAEAGEGAVAGSAGQVGAAPPEPPPAGEPAAVPCATPLAERVEIHNISVSPATINVDEVTWTDPVPVLLSVSDAGTARVGWAAADGTVHVTEVDAGGTATGSELTTPGDGLRGLVSHDDGAALLVRRGDAMHFVRLDRANEPVVDLRLVGDNAHTVSGDQWVNHWGHNSRLAWSGTTYAAYYGICENFGADDSHQGDVLQLLDAAGNSVAGGWDWGCSHSDDVRIAYNGSGPQGGFGPVCSSDGFPVSGISFNNRDSLFEDPTSNESERLATRLGGLVPLPDGFLLSFTSPVGRASADVALLKVANNGDAGSPVWLTETPQAESTAKLAAYGDLFLVAWSAAGTTQIATVTAEGAFVDMPTAIDADLVAGGDFVNYANGDVGWAFASDTRDALMLVRVSACI
jgi:hypothetical protein